MAEGSWPVWSARVRLLAVLCLLLVPLQLLGTTPRTASADSVVTTSSKLPSPEGQLTAQWINGKAYLTGGLYSYNACNLSCVSWQLAIDSSIYAFDPGANTVTKVTNLPVGVVDAASFSDGRYMYIVGGNNDRSGSPNGVQGQIYRYDPVANVVTQMAATIYQGRSEAAVAWDGTYAYLMGGVDATGNESLNVLRYDPANDVLADTGVKLPYNLRRMGAFWANGKAYAMGGYTNNFGSPPQTFLNFHLQAFDPATNTATVLGVNFPAGLADIESSVYWDGTKAHVLGGVTQAAVGGPQQVTAQIFSFDPATQVSGDLAPAAATLPTPLNSGAVVFDGARAYYLGGRNTLPGGNPNPNDFTNSILRYDPDQPAVQVQSATLPTGRYGIAGAYDGKLVYLAGGFDEYSTDIFKYDPITDTMTKAKSQLPSGRWGSTSIPSGGSIIIMGGKTPTGPTDDILKFDPVADTISKVGVLPSGRWGSTGFSDGRWLYLLGGADNVSAWNQVLRIDPASYAVTLLTTMPSGRWGSTGIWTGSTYYLVGGNDGHDVALSDVLKFTPSTGLVQSALGTLPSGRWGSTSIWDGAAGIVMGGTNGSMYFGDVLRYDPTSGSFTPSPSPLPSGRWGSTSIWDGSAIYSIGGDQGSAGYTNQVVKILDQPGPPQNLSATTAGASTTNLSWSAPDSSTYSPGTIANYRIYRGASLGAETLLTTVAGTQTSYSDAATPAGGVYYRVSAVTSSGLEGPYSNEASTTNSTPPGPAGTVTASPGTRGQINVSWSAPAVTGGSPITGYNLTQTNNSTHQAISQIVSAPATSAVMGGLADATSYSYTLAAINSVGTGPTGNIASAVTAGPPSEPRTPAASANGAGQVSVSWSVPATDGGSPITGYSVYRTLNGTTSTAGTVAAGIYSFQDSGLANGSTYSYTVAAGNAIGNGPNSAPASATTWSAPSAPQSPSASATGAGQITVSWNPPASNGGGTVSSYNVYRSSGGGAASLAGSTTGTSYVDSGLAASTTYTYTVSAVSSVGEGPGSAPASATTWSAPSAPQSPSASATGAGQLTVSWNPPASTGGGSVTSYNVYRSTGGGAPAQVGSTTGTSYVDAGLAAATTYTYSVSAVNSVGEGPRSASASATTWSTPGAPTSTSASATGVGQLTVNWSPPASTGGGTVSSYNVYRSSGGGPATLVGSTTAPGTSYVDSALAASTTYTYTVSAVTSVGEGPRSGPASATTWSPPAAPAAPAVSATGVGRLTVSWAAPASNGGSAVTGYRVYRHQGATTTLVASPSASTLSYVDSGLASSTSYAYTVSAVSAVGEGAQSRATSASTWSPPAAPAAPGVSATAVGQLTVSWAAPASNGGSAVTGYRLYRQNTAGGTVTLVASPSASTLSYVDSGLANSTAYSYTVSAVNAVGEGAQSAARSASTWSPPSAPTGLASSVAGAGQLNLTWNPPAGNGGTSVTQYQVYRSSPGVAAARIATVGAPATSYLDSGLTLGATYTYTVSAVNAVGEGAQSASLSAQAAATPSAPLNPSATGSGAHQVTVRWSPPSGDGGSPVTGYRVYRADPSGARILLASVGLATQYVDNSVTGGLSYLYSVSALNAAGEGPLSLEVQVLASDLPAAPTGVVVSVSGPAQLSVSWNAPAGNGSAVTSYQIFRSDNGGGLVQLATVTNPGFLDSGLTGGHHYGYSISANNAVGTGPASAEVTTMAVDSPTPPRNLHSQVGPGAGQYTLSWTPPLLTGGPALVSYNLYESHSATGPEATHTVDASHPSYTESDCRLGEVCYFAVDAYNGYFSSGRSARISVVGLASPLGAPFRPGALPS